MSEYLLGSLFSSHAAGACLVPSEAGGGAQGDMGQMARGCHRENMIY